MCIKMPHLWFRCYSGQEASELFATRWPFRDFIGNDNAVETALDILYEAFTEEAYTDTGAIYCRRCCRRRLALIGPRSAGKTEFARCFARGLGTPLAELDGTSLSSMDDVLNACLRAWDAQKAKVGKIVARDENGVSHYTLPPMTLYIDEVHALSAKNQDKLLKACEPNDGMMILRDKVVNFKEVCVIVTTTDSGKLRKAFKSRFTRLDLENPTPEMIAEIIKKRFSGWRHEDCMSVGRLRPVAREAIEFAKLVLAAQKRSGGSLTENIEVMRERLGLNTSGLSRRSLQILSFLDSATDGLSRTALVGMAGIEEDEFENEILPELLGSGSIEITNRHRITERGRRIINENEEIPYENEEEEKREVRKNNCSAWQIGGAKVM